MAETAERIAVEIEELQNEKEEVKRQAQAAPADRLPALEQRLLALDQRLLALDQRLAGLEQDLRELRRQQQQGEAHLCMDSRWTLKHAWVAARHTACMVWSVWHNVAAGAPRHGNSRRPRLSRSCVCVVGAGPAR
jgi:hypothetical protein